MSFKAVPIALMFGVTPALAFDTSKLGQWGSPPLGDLMPLIGKSPQLLSEVQNALHDSNKTPDTLICDGMRFPGAWLNLGGERVAPYTCAFAGKWLQISADVRVTGKNGRVLATASRTAMRQATNVSETNVSWKWSDTDPNKGN